MAERRMFAKTIIDSDAFMDMPSTARLLYYDLAMRADDDGFINSPKKIQRMVGASDDDLKLLAAKKFIIPFETGVVVIKHWRIHNYIRKDTYNETNYKEEKASLTLDENNAYRALPSTVRGRSVDESWTQVRIGKDRIDNTRAQNVMTFGDGVTDYHDDMGTAEAVPMSPETLPALSSPTKSLKAKKEPKYGPVAHAVKEVIWNGTIKASGLVLTPQQSGAQAKALWEVVNRIVLQFGEEDAIDAAHSIIGTYNRLRQSDRFMAKQPLTPLALAGQGIWGQVLEAMREQRLTPEMQDFVAEVLKAQGGRA